MTLLTIDEAGKRLKLGRSTMYDLVRKGEVPAYKIGGSLRISEDDLGAYIASCRLPGKSKDRRKQPRPKLKHIEL